MVLLRYLVIYLSANSDPPLAVDVELWSVGVPLQQQCILDQIVDFFRVGNVSWDGKLDDYLGAIASEQKVKEKEGRTMFRIMEPCGSKRLVPRRFTK